MSVEINKKQERLAGVAHEGSEVRVEG